MVHLFFDILAGIFLSEKEKNKFKTFQGHCQGVMRRPEPCIGRWMVACQPQLCQKQQGVDIVLFGHKGAARCQRSCLSQLCLPKTAGVQGVEENGRREG